ncbi:MAG TPA: glycoside hydrolase family 28 protein [Lacunisphaera sp.]|nr:glycoside hydrolase family 28 protein [Lacunisphaera sp.]
MKLRLPVFGALLALLVVAARAATPTVFNVLDHGVVPDGTTKNTAALAAVIAKVKEAGGGTLYFPPGRYLTGSIHLESNLTLHLEGGATLLYSPDPVDSPLVPSRWEGTTAWTYGPLIYANGKENITITGRGTIDGQGQNWWWRAADKTPRRDVAEKARPVWQALMKRIQGGDGAKVTREDFVEAANFLRPSLVVPFECKNIVIEGVTITNSPMWLLHTIYSENITVRGVSFISHGPNGDGYDLDSSRNVRISDCYFDTGDDCIVIKSGKDADGRRVNRPTELVTITNCVMHRGHGAVTIGSETSGGIRDITASNIVCRGTDRGIRLKTQRGRGAVIENVRFDNWVIIDAPKEAIHITSNYSRTDPAPKSETTPTFRNIALSNITVVNAEQVVGIAGLAEQAIEQVRITDLTGNGKIGLTCDAADDVELHDIRIDAQQGPVFNFTNSRRLRLDNLVVMNPPAGDAPVVSMTDVAEAVLSGSRAAKGTGVQLKIDGAASKAITVAGCDFSAAKQAIATTATVAGDAVTQR